MFATIGLPVCWLEMHLWIAFCYRESLIALFGADYYLGDLQPSRLEVGAIHYRHN